MCSSTDSTASPSPNEPQLFLSSPSPWPDSSKGRKSSQMFTAPGPHHALLVFSNSNSPHRFMRFMHSFITKPSSVALILVCWHADCTSCYP
jgi:hypothetical protein